MSLKLITYLYSLFLVLTCSCNTAEKDTKEKEITHPLILNLDDFDSTYHNDTVNIQGYLQKYQPMTSGKGAGEQFFDYVIMLSDSNQIPIKKGVVIDEKFIDQPVVIIAVTSKSPIHDQPCPPYCQNTVTFWQIKSVVDVEINKEASNTHEDPRQETQSNTVSLSSKDLELNTHFKNGDYIISVNDSIGKRLIDQLVKLQDSSIFKLDTIDLQLTDPYWTNIRVKRVLRQSIEMAEVKIYSLTKNKYLDKIERTVSKSKFNEIHNYYMYSNFVEEDTILCSYSFDTGTPPF